MRRMSGLLALMLCAAPACDGEDDPVCRGACGPADAGSLPDADTGEGSDAGGGEDAGAGASVTACLGAAKSKDTRTEALRLIAKDGTQVAVVRYQDPDGFGTSGTTIWLPERLGYARGEDLACVTESSKLDYQISHHNFDDTMAAQSGDLTVTFRQAREDYDKPMFFSVEAKRGDDVVWGPLDLTLVSCTELTDSSDCSERY